MELSLSGSRARLLSVVCCFFLFGLQTIAQPDDRDLTAAEKEQIAEIAKQGDALDARLAGSVALSTASKAALQQTLDITSRADYDPPTAMEKYIKVLQLLLSNGLPDAFNGESKALNSQLTAFSTACDKLQVASDAPQSVLDAKHTCDSKKQQGADEVSQLDNANKLLTAAIKAIPGSLKELVKAGASELDDLKTFTAKTEAVDLVKTLPRLLPHLRNALELQDQTISDWKSLQRLLSSNVSQDDLGQVQNALNDWVCTTRGVTGNRPATCPSPTTPSTAITGLLADWFTTLTNSLQGTTTDLNSTVPKVLLDPATNAAEALGRTKDGNALLGKLETILGEWRKSAALLQGAKEFDYERARTAAEKLNLAAGALRAVISRIDDSLAGDTSHFETDNVHLFYFTDVKRLVKALNSDAQEIGGLDEARAAAAEERRKLTESELQLADAQAQVNRLQRSVQELEEQQRQQSAGSQALQLVQDKLGVKLKQDQRSQAKAEDNLAAAQDAAKSSPNDPAKARAVDIAQQARDRSVSKTQQSNSNFQNAKADTDKANEKIDASKTDQDGLPAKIALARAAMEAAQLEVAAQRRRMLLAAQAESEAFATARDNAPFLFAGALGSSNNPAKRVIIFGYDDSKNIVLRGRRQDIEFVREIIAKFDIPAPQARLTLWNFELNGQLGSRATTNRRDAANLNRSMEIVDEELGNTRAMINATLGFLKTLVNETARRGDQQDGDHPRYSCNPSFDAASARGLPESIREKWYRVHFFDPAVLKELGLDLDDPDLSVVRIGMPDPSATTTLGETLLMLSLSCPKIRNDIREQFLKGVAKELTGLSLRVNKAGEYMPADLKNDLGLPSEEQIPCSFPLTWRTPGLTDSAWSQTQTSKDCHGSSTASVTPLSRDVTESVEWLFGITAKQPRGELTATQFEITHAIRSAVQQRQRDKIISRLYRHSKDLADLGNRLEESWRQVQQLRGDSSLRPEDISRMETLEDDMHNANVKGDRIQDSSLQEYLGLERKMIPAKREQFQAKMQDVNQTRVRMDNIVADDMSLIKSLWTNANIHPADVEWDTLAPCMTNLTNQRKLPNPANKPAKPARSFSDTPFPQSDLCPSYRRFASIDESFASTYREAGPSDSATARVAAADEMLKEMTIAMEDDIDKLFIQPMLSRLRNRLFTEGQVNVGVLQRESMLATNRLLARIDPRASAQLQVGQQEDILASVQQLAQLYLAAQSGGATAALGALNKQPREAPPEIYGVGTGDTFQVTPIFDPSGQALRFKFDYVSQVRIQEPTGGTNPQLPRIERHTINTEVQLSNLETREITRFESNAKIGIPTQYSGGLPIFKDIPVVRYIPLLGWFVRKAGSNAAVQQSVIFGQTTIYPTIGSLVNLLLSEDVASGLEVPAQDAIK